MITLSVADARISRQKLAEQAGPNFVPRDKVIATLVGVPVSENHQFLFAISESDQRWTAVSVSSMIGMSDGKLSELFFQKEAQLVHDFFGRDKGKEKPDVILDDGRKFWMKSVGIACSIQNIKLLLQDLPEGVVLED